MRRKVPFMGEGRVGRAGDDEPEAKKECGLLIDEVLSTQEQPSSWDDLVTNDYPDPIGAPAKVTRANPPAASSMSANIGANAAQQRVKKVPPSPGAILKKPPVNGAYSSASAGSIDWLPINSGHGLRINICGKLDQNLRRQWRKLLEDASKSGVGQFEFNFTEAPTLTLTGLGMLLLFKEQKGSERSDIKLCHCNKDVWQMLKWTGMDKYFTIQGAPPS